ncbi:hypothetical protein CS0771_30310 [Catellatospora sp. IY07-71]|uniref:hypothetical protein n=1 Tax=Catellatospora sp. IY07-71 TaxID=2728827 RepID=UPI001BB2FA2F|nr:hypothetical protein [Catellatospora sp. IY07-71]BCJ73487.1 hypothetical protein CS0771_30310 [Catellatospora sp. IY07-71]
MRHVLSTTVLSLTLLGSAACTADPAATTAAPSSPAVSAAASSAAPAVPTGTKDENATCLAFIALSTSQQGALGVLGATMKIIGAAINDEAKAATLIPDLSEAIEVYRAELAKISADTADAELKAALEADLATVVAGQQAVTAANGDLDKIIEVLEGPALDFEDGGKTGKICVP